MKNRARRILLARFLYLLFNSPWYSTDCSTSRRLRRRDRRTVLWARKVLLVWSVLALVRQFRKIPAARIAVFTLAVSFTVLSCVNVNQRIIDFNLWQYEQGYVQRLDTGVLRSLGWQG